MSKAVDERSLVSNFLILSISVYVSFLPLKNKGNAFFKDKILATKNFSVKI